ncbi:MAG: DUF4123 domain-containing protein [Deltaproteobacteria bacterium]|jgi:hypothetical protein|nr:DUF4123 domain-containing protein [Deltaproteobacteria bacterium]
MPWRPAFAKEKTRRLLWPDPAPPEGLVMAVIDPVQWPEILPLLSRQAADWLPADTGEHLRTHGEVLPCVTALLPEDPVTEAVLDRAGNESGIFLRAAGDPRLLVGRVARHLAVCAACTLPEGGAAFLRLQDPNILRAWMAVATDGQKSLLFGAGITDFWAEDVVLGEYARYTAPESPPEPCGTPARISPGQLEALLEAQHRKYLEDLEDYSINTLGPISGEAQLRAVRAGVHTCAALAETYGFSLRGQITDFVALGTAYGFGFHQSPQVKTILENTAAPADERLRAVAALLSGWAAEQAARRTDGQTDGRTDGRAERGLRHG